MSFLNKLQTKEKEIVETYLQPIRFSKNTCIVREGNPGDGCYFIDRGEVRLEVQDVDIAADGVLAYLKPGMFLGEFSLLDGRSRSASAYAQGDVVARWFSKADFDVLCERHPRIGLTISQALGQNLSSKLRCQNNRMVEYLFADEIDPQTNEMVARAVAAQQAFEDWSEAQVDALLKDLAEAIAAQASELAQATVTETGMGVVEDKVAKIRFGSLDVFQGLTGQTALGTIQTDYKRQITEIASPVGVVLGLIPLTNPVSTLIFKTLICLKGRNALILSCHRDALGVGNRAGEIIQDVLRQHGAPVELVQWIRERTSRRKTMMFMKHPDVSFILATGGPSMVKAAYSSGTPAIGVGSGNAPVWISADADLNAAARIIVQSKSFDNGLICGSENNLVVDVSIRQAFLKEIEAQGALILTPDQATRFTALVFDKSGHLPRSLVGKSASHIAQFAGISHQNNASLIVAPVGLEALSGPLGREKLAPILSLFTVEGEAEGLRICQQILKNQGQGHTAIVHTQNPELAKRFGVAISASRILVNSPGSQGCIGLVNGLTPSLTLGCGTYGGNSTTDNVSYTHLLNVKRLALSV